MINCWGILATIFLFKSAQRLKKYPFFKELPPVLFAGVIIFCILKYGNISFDNYNQSARILTFLLIPATIALGYPLYKNSNILTKNKRIIYTALIFSSLCTIIITFVVAKLCHTNINVIISMLPKSVTAPIAIEISKLSGGIPELTACIVVLTGVFGAIVGHKILKLCRVKNDIAIGLSLGAASHMIATSKCVELKRPKQIVMATLGLVLTGIITAILIPIFIHFF